jgi:hypothetical protein
MREPVDPFAIDAGLDHSIPPAVEQRAAVGLGDASMAD